jgi:hypothetical protein
MPVRDRLSSRERPFVGLLDSLSKAGTFGSPTCSSAAPALVSLRGLRRERVEKTLLALL